MDMDLVKNITMRTKYEAADIEDITVALKGISKMSFFGKLLNYGYAVMLSSPTILPSSIVFINLEL
jgi:hypothetical protein